MRVIVTLALVCALAGVARATPTEKLAEARQKFRAGDWEGTIVMLYPLLSPPVLSTAEDLTEAQIMMAVAYFETNDHDNAAQWFEEALFIDEAIELDPELYSPEVVDFFNQVKQRLKEKLDEASERARLAREREAYRRALENALEVERHPYYINFLPFGAGQFQNGHRRKGTAFAISQASLGGTSVIMFGIQWLQWGIPLDIPADDLDLAANIQRVQVATGVAFFAVYAWSVVDALVYHQPTVTRRLDPQHIPPELLDPELAPRRESALRLSPMGGPDTAGLMLEWGF